MHPDEFANVNGTVTPIDRATIPINDHGFLYGDGVYETVRTYAGHPFHIEGHLDRLERSAAAIRLRLAWSRDQIRAEIGRTLEAARAAAAPGAPGEYAIRLMATRGPGPLGYDPELCPRPSLVVLVTRLRQLTDAEREVGVAAIIASLRRNPIESLDPRIKSSNLLNNILAAQQAKDAHATEAILFNTAGYLAEGTLTNVFFVAQERVHTPSLDCGILSGITREIVLECLAAAGIPHEQGRYRREQFLAADEIFLTSTTREVFPVARLDASPVGGGRRGPVTRRVQEMFRARVEEMLRSEAEAR